MRTKHVTTVGPICGFIFFTFIAMVENNECEEKGQYRAETGLCCQLCSKGKRWRYDCYSDGESAFCTACSLGMDYMDVANHDSECKKCSTCNALYENVQQACNLTSDTVCQCKNGYSRAHPSEPCPVTSNTENYIGISIGIVIFIVALGILYFLKKRHLHTFQTVVTEQDEETVPLQSVEGLEGLRMLIDTNMKSSDADIWKQLNKYLPEVHKSVSENSLFTLHNICKTNRISVQQYWEAQDITDNSARAVYLLKHIINEGEEMCQHILKMIHIGEDQQMQLQTLLNLAGKCSPDLNPNTAHEELTISDNYKMATWNEEPSPKPYNPDRFDHWTQVLSSNSFEGGCHYWVVNVGCVNKFRIGVAYGIILRKGDGGESMVGLNGMAWCVRRLINKYTAWHEKQYTELEVGDHPRRIGVGLDYHNGVLVFYNADNNTHLHTFYARFSHPLYVALWLMDGVVTIEDVNAD